MPRISELSATTGLDGTEEIPAARAGETVKVTSQQIADLATVAASFTIAGLPSAASGIDPTNELAIDVGGTMLRVPASAIAALASLTEPLQCIAVACSDESTALTAGTAKVTFRMPFAFTLTAVRASLTTAQASGSIFTVDINEAGATILSTKITIDNTEKTSTAAAAPPVVSDLNLADDAEVTVDIDQVGDGTAAGLKVYLIGRPA